MHPAPLLDACSEALSLVLCFDYPADSVLSRFFKENRNLGQKDRKTISDTIYTILRKKPFFEALAKTGSSNKERNLVMLAFTGPRDLLREAISESEWRWLCECKQATPQLKPTENHNLPTWLSERLLQQFGEDEFNELSRSLLWQNDMDLRVNTFKAKLEDVQKSLLEDQIDSKPTPHSPDGLRLKGRQNISRCESFLAGSFEVQSEGSQLLALLVGAKRGEMVADFCAGAGGKTLALGAMMRSTGCLYAFDVSHKRLDGLKPRLARSGLSNVRPVVISNERDDRIKRLRGKMDRVLVDAPCSGTGTLRGNPDLKWRLSEKDLTDLVQKQASILEAAQGLVKLGGRLIYATCSLLQEENEKIVEQFSLDHPEFQPVACSEILLKSKIEEIEKITSDDGLYLKILPHKSNTDGFFAAAWKCVS